MKRNKILIIDDDIDFINKLKARLKQHGYEIIYAENQHEGEKLIKEVDPNLCVVDLVMDSQISGFILCYKIKKHNPEIPVIIVSSVISKTRIKFDITHENHKQWIYADSYLNKDVGLDEIVYTVNSFMNKE